MYNPLKKSLVLIFVMAGLLVWAKESQADVPKIITPTQILKSWYMDRDGDGYGTDASKKISITKPSAPKLLGTYVNQGGDCNDFVKTINPGATETCNGKDDNCSGAIDEGVTNACGTCRTLSTETCNELDDNCDGTIDEGVQTTYYSDADGDGYGNLSFTMDTCALPVGYVANSRDCDDSNSLIKPGARETCDFVDNDCDGSVDEGYSTHTYYQDADGDSYGNISVSSTACMAPSGYVTNSYDCNDSDPLAYRTTSYETCDGGDNNCDGTIDEGITYYLDSDGDGYGLTTTTTTAIISGCSPAGYADRSGDCNDSDAAIKPHATETYNDGIDSDCDDYEIVYSTTAIDSSGTVGSYNSIGVQQHVSESRASKFDLEKLVNPYGQQVESGERWGRRWWDQGALEILWWCLILLKS